jgi:hypothetical protein
MLFVDIVNLEDITSKSVEKPNATIKIEVQIDFKNRNSRLFMGVYLITGTMKRNYRKSTYTTQKHNTRFHQRITHKSFSQHWCRYYIHFTIIFKQSFCHKNSFTKITYLFHPRCWSNQIKDTWTNKLSNSDQRKMF